MCARSKTPAQAGSSATRSITGSRPRWRGGASKRHRPPASGGHRRAFRSRLLVPLGQVPAPAPQPRPGRIDGQDRHVCRQRAHGVVLRAAPEERARPPTTEQQRGVTPGDGDLDRTDLPSPAPSAAPWQAHADRVRDPPRGRSCGLRALNRASQPQRGQSRRLADELKAHVVERQAEASERQVVLTRKLAGSPMSEASYCRPSTRTRSRSSCRKRSKTASASPSMRPRTISRRRRAISRPGRTSFERLSGSPATATPHI